MTKIRYFTPEDKSKYQQLFESSHMDSTKESRICTPVRPFILFDEPLFMPEPEFKYPKEIKPFSKNIMKKLSKDHRQKIWQANHSHLFTKPKKISNQVLNIHGSVIQMRMFIRAANAEVQHRPLMTKSEYECEVHMHNRDVRERKAEEEYNFECWLEYYEKN